MAKQHLHEKLGITFQELGALLGTRALIVSGALVHDGTKRCDPGVHKINMNCACDVYECGSVHCIGGTMGLLMGKDQWETDTYVRKSRYESPLGDLFYPPVPDNRSLTVGAAAEPSGGAFYLTITPDKMLAAIDNFLENGKPRWKSLFRNVKHWQY